MKGFKKEIKDPIFVFRSSHLFKKKFKINLEMPMENNSGPIINVRGQNLHSETGTSSK